MAWVRIDDQFTDHPKVGAAGPLASWFYVCGLVYAARYLTDGFVPAFRLPQLAAVNNPQELADILVFVGLWDKVEGGYMAHDYLEYNPSAETVKAEREASKDRMAKMRGRRKSVTVAVTPPVTPPVTPMLQRSSPSPSPSPSSLLRKDTSQSDGAAIADALTEPATPQESAKPAKAKRTPKYSGEEQAYVAELLQGVKAITGTKGSLPSEGRERQAGHWFYTADDGQPAPIDAVLACYRIAKAQPWRGGRYLSLQSLEADYVEYRRDPTAYRNANSKLKPGEKRWIRPTGTDGPDYSQIKRLE